MLIANRGKLCLLWWMVLLSGLALSGSVPSALAEVVAVNRGTGQGFVFQRRNICYLVLPHHVSGRGLNLTLSAGAPPVVGAARIFKRFEDIDLAVAVVDGDFQGRCSARYEDLPRRVDIQLGSGSPLTLVRVEASGLVRREPVSVREILYEHILVEPLDGTDGIYQGTSGAFLFSGSQPVAMMLSARPDGAGIALRLDAILDRINRLLDGGVGGNDPTFRPAEQQSPGFEGLSFRVDYCSPEPLDPDHGCAALETQDGYVLLPAGRSIFVLELDGDEDKDLKTVIIGANWQEGAEYTVPRALIIEADSSTAGSLRWRRFAAGDMTPFGTFSHESGAGQKARRLRIHILNSWDAMLPMRLDQVTLR